MASSELFWCSLLTLLSMGVSSTITNTTTREYGRTNLKSERLTYEWTIQNFKLLPQENGENFYSPVFRTESKDVEWRLSLYPKGQTASVSDYVSLFLHLDKAPKMNITVHCDMSIFKSETVHSKKTCDHTFDKISGWGYQYFILRSELINLINTDDTFTLRVEFDMPLTTITEPFNLTDPLEEELSHDLQKDRLIEHFRSLLDEAKFSDLVIVVGKEHFPVHKLVLSARSSVFEAILKENQTNEIRIEKMEPMVMNATLEFIYTDDVTDLEPLASGLLAAADRFELARLKTMCERVLYKSINEDNAADILVLTDLHRSNKLKKHVMKFMASHLSAVMKSKGYKKMEDTSPKLLKELLYSVGHKNSNSDVCEC